MFTLVMANILLNSQLTTIILFVISTRKKKYHEDINSYSWILFRYQITIRGKMQGESTHPSRLAAYIELLGRIHGHQTDN
jgi:hypothetical protein